jgi:hypothetical protein
VLDGSGAVTNPAGTAAPPMVAPGPGAAAVQVVASGRVGPYDYVQLAVDDSLPDPADVALNWLSENGYDVSNVGGEILGSYLEMGLDLIAFRLTKGNDSGSIRPIALSWEGDKPVIPIRPTAVAANDDMGVLVWVLGDDRAIPENYLHLELNEAKINWFNPGPTYGQVVTAAADEAGSYGFVTEQSGPASDFAPSLVPASLEYDYDYLSTGMFASMEDFLSYAISVNTTFDPITFEATYYDGFLDVMNDPMALPLREGATVEQFLSCVGCYFQVDVAVRNDAYPTTPFDPATDPLLAMDVGAFLDELEESVLQPMLDTQDLFNEYSTVTRLYTTLSAIEMTDDPVFDFNPDLEPVSNIHTGERLIQCNGRHQITLPQGIVLDTDGSTWPVSIDDELPMNLRLLQLSTEGDGEVVVDNTDRVAESLTDLGLGSLSPLIAPPEDDDGPDPADDDAADDDVADDDAEGDDDAADDDAEGDDDAADDDTSSTEADPASDDGCGCRIAGAPATPRGVPLLLGSLLGLACWARRRERARRLPSVCRV